VARHWERAATGVLLTGMGRDGASGLLAMRQAGQSTIAQDQASSAVYGMPRAAAELGAAQQILPLGKIIDALTLARQPPG
jgi:two-component system response regulator WspF